MAQTIYKKREGIMPIVKFLEHGQVTIPKKFRDALGVKKGDPAEAIMEGEKIIITPVKLISKEQAWKELREVMEEVHRQNEGVSEEEVIQDALKAISELRQEEYAQRKT